MIIYGPTLTTTPSSLNFGSVTANTTSVPAQYFAMNGTYMGTGPLAISAPPNYILSLDGVNWTPPGGSTNYSYTPPNISSSTAPYSNIYVKFVAPSTPGNYCGNISISGGGLATPVLVNVCGTSAATCSGVVTAGTAAVTPASGGSASYFTLSLTGASAGGGLTYQWQSGPSNTCLWTNISGAIQPTYSFTGIAANTYYQCIVTCPGGSTATSGNVEVTLQTTPTYCTPSEGVGSGSNPGQNASVGQGAAYPFKITGVTPTVLTDPSTSGTSTYYNQTATGYTCTMMPGGSYTFKVGGVVSAYASCQIWIDFNNDGTFTTSSESVGGIANYYSSSTQATGTLTIPSTVLPGIYRMRVQAAYSENAAPGQTTQYPVYPDMDPCTAITPVPQYEETRDYIVTIGQGHAPACRLQAFQMFLQLQAVQDSLPICLM